MTEVGYQSLKYVLEAMLKNGVDLTWLVFVSGDKIPEERRGEIRDVFTWFKELERSGNLGIDNLEFLKEVLDELQKFSCLEKINEFEDKRRQIRMGRARNTGPEDNSGEAVGGPVVISEGSAIFGGAFSTVKWAAGKLIGVVDIKCVYGLAGAGVLTGATHYILKNCQGNPGLVVAFNSCALPAGVKLIELSKGCVCLTVQAESLSALKALWEKYENGSLRMSLEELLVTDEIKEMAKGKDLELTVTIDQCSYRNACLDLLIVENGAREKVRGINSCPRKRTMSDSALVVKSNGDIVTQQHSELSVAAEERRREPEELIQKDLRNFRLQELVDELDSGSAESGYKTESLREDSSELDTKLGEPLSEDSSGLATKLREPLSEDSSWLATKLREYLRADSSWLDKTVRGEINVGSEQPRQSPMKYPTLLHFASKYGLASLVKNLLKACLMRNSDCQRPDNLAEDSGHLELAKSLRSFEASTQHRAEDESGDFYEDMRTQGDEPCYVDMIDDPEAEYIDMDGRRYFYCTKQEGAEYYTYTNTRAYQNSTRGDGTGDEDDIYYVDMKNQALDYIDRNGRRYYYLPDQNIPGENQDSEQLYEEMDNSPGAGPIYDVPKSNAPVEEIARSVSVSMSQQQKRRLNSKRQGSSSTMSSTSSSIYSSSREEEEEPDRVSRREILEQLKEKQKEKREMDEAPLPPPPDYQHKASTLPPTSSGPPAAKPRVHPKHASFHQADRRKERPPALRPRRPSELMACSISTISSTSSSGYSSSREEEEELDRLSRREILELLKEMRKESPPLMSSGPPSAKPRVHPKHASFHQADRRKERPPALRPRRPSEQMTCKSFESRDEKRDLRVPSAPMEERPPPPLPREKEKDPSSPRLPTPKPRSKKY